MAVREAVFGAEFGHGEAEGFYEEDGVITEAAATARGVDEETFDGTRSWW